MPKLNDDHALMTSGVLLAGLGALAVVPKTQKYTLDPLLEKGKTFESCWGTVGGADVGITAVSLGIRDIVLASNKDAKEKTKKNALKVAGFTHLAYAAWVGKAIHQKDFQVAPGAVASAAHAGVAGLCLWRGFRKSDDEDKPAPSTATKKK
ncbi:hypothetical protein HYH03_009732 [Edaphochlamys debaryana]|uniref:Uncharacterized protein n=1 Tax=Edaphochlamys debaryana TaxID=47281 RepID=A0A835XVQ0_9CHLO|nr:hypothetical protein HYH03_009732 [Edaphochlamys debaryana]|eukprot:KAG2492002.1 hypothetical protein HYH03_009732 [Edaphochlamys debaryana]